MEVQRFDAARAALNAGVAAWPRVIEAVGTPSFERELCRVAHEMTQCQTMSAFAHRFDGPPRIMAAADAGPQQVVWQVGAKYISRYWELDPIYGMSEQEILGASAVAVRVSPRDIVHSGYRHDCFTARNVIDRLTILHHRCGAIMRLNFYRTRATGRFSEDEIDAVMRNTEMIGALVAKHQAIDAPSSRCGTAEALEQRIRVVAPLMPERERQVCVGIARGLSSEAIALALRISVNTVLTYRKRAYTRLNISSQNELMRLILC